ncbi:MAG TPA: acetyl-CoA C-acetyltransferase [Herpetosiphon sp.]|uniref:acetyl-CoA C-acetyltransferase n=1 Tax=Herpetosiphon aurantiacus (strain ATCC 23779 / DSM 785 / 114-95) TaxID=316274 RepID=A9AV93_HERA2|nr:acetyl-CoA C-acetyltransferase [Herpetosiphon sp.]ABX03171.1 acetyl-CoA acetyltransferase [Herpetosiphon aurantiacus DSM 785]HBW50725.1 acetyl-CoA C-acetyltransferase [Herpetosiphon sp.]
MSNEREPVLLSAARTPIGKFGGSLADLTAPQLGAIAIKAALERAGINGDVVDEVIMGNVVGAGLGQAPARQAALGAGVPDSVSALTINKVCGSGLKAVMLAASMIKAGDAELIVAGGMENMSRAPYLLPQARFGYRLGNGEIQDAVVHDGLWCAVEHHHMGNSAEWVADACNVSREMQDEFAYNSHRKAAAAIARGAFKNEIVPVELKSRKGTTIFDTDEPVRADSTVEALAKLKPAFKADGSVTAGNAPGITDGASALVVASMAKAQQLGAKPLARITGYAQAGVKPLEIFTAPAFAVRRLLEVTNTSLADYDLYEFNEAFAAQALANGHDLKIDWDRLNVNGGAVALGHPIGASGARVLTTLVYALQERGGKRGLATLCLGGGEAVALAIELI